MCIRKREALSRLRKKEKKGKEGGAQVVSLWLLHLIRSDDEKELVITLRIRAVSSATERQAVVGTMDDGDGPRLARL